MRTISQSVKRIFIPRISKEIQREIDRGNVRNMHLVSAVVLCVETAMLLAYVAAHLGGFDGEEIISVLRVCVCILVCAANMAVTLHMTKNQRYDKLSVTLVTVSSFIFLVAWSVQASYSQYLRGEQMLTFYGVILCFLCFIAFRPLVSCAITLAAYAGVWLTAWLTDRAQGLNIFNFLVLAILTAAGMIIRYDQQIKVSRSFLELQERNRDLAHASRHDALTGLYNREALSQDRERFYGAPLVVILADIDYFKQVNDVHGHVVGDRALREAGRLLQALFPESSIYRYGGDEFLVVLRSVDMPVEAGVIEERRRFDLPIREGILELCMSFGAEAGAAANEAEFMALIDRADEKLYEIKSRVHAINGAPRI